MCAFDVDHRVKDVTRRYNSCTSASVRRARQLDDKDKQWWTRCLLRLLPFDAQLDMAEERRLQISLLGDEHIRPESVGELKDHPLYVIKRHLLKFQALFPPNVEPAYSLRNEENVYMRENLATLHSRQTWLKYARVVKPFENAYKVVKGRLKRVRKISSIFMQARNFSLHSSLFNLLVYLGQQAGPWEIYIYILYLDFSTGS